VRQQPIDNEWQSQRNTPDCQEYEIRNSGNRHHSTKLKSKSSNKQDVRDGYAHFELLRADKSQQKHWGQPCGEGNGIGFVGKHQQGCCYRQPEPRSWLYPAGPLCPARQIFQARLFKAEADQYEQFRSNESYPSWLSWLADRVIRRVIDAYKKLEQTNDATLAYHGHTVERIQENLKANFSGLVPEYARQGTVLQVNSEPQALLKPSIEPYQKLNERETLHNSYRVAFPGPGIMDICWAAEQHYREWARWLKGQLKDGSKPDRAFRRVLTSSKDARELRKGRPKNWK